MSNFLIVGILHRVLLEMVIRERDPNKCFQLICIRSSSRK